MRLKYKVDEVTSDDWELLGYKFNGPLVLSRDPVSNNEVATKDYVDNEFSTLSVSSMTGVLATNRLPSFSGDISNSSSSGVFTLSNSGVTPGTYTRIRVNSKGRVIDGGSLTVNDLPALPFSKFKNRPTTLAGYGITSTLSTSGGLVGSDFRIVSTPTDPLHLISRSSVSGLTGELVVMEPGTVIMNSSEGSLPGYIRLNGAMVNKSDYPDLYRVIGDKYWLDNKFYGYGKPWQQRYGIDNTAVMNLTLGTSLYNSLFQGKDQFSITLKNNSYLLGGDTVSGYGTIYRNYSDLIVIRQGYSTINNSDSIKVPDNIDYCLISGMSQVRTATTIATYYNVGGGSRVFGTFSDVQFPSMEFRWGPATYMTQSWSGVVSGWTSIGQRVAKNASITGNASGSVTYVFDGISSIENVYTYHDYEYTDYPGTTFTVTYSDETSTSWVGNSATGRDLDYYEQTYVNTHSKRVDRFNSVTNTSNSRRRVRYPNALTAKNNGHILQETVIDPEVLAVNGELYIFGGENNSGITDLIQVSSINPTGTEFTTWSNYGTLPEKLSGHKGFVFGNQIYLIGGRTPLGPSDKIYRTTANPDGSLNSWTQVGLLDIPLHGHSLILVGTDVYIIGGIAPTGNSNKVYRSRISSSGELGVFSEYMTLPVSPGRTDIYVTSSSFSLLSKDYIVSGIISRTGIFNISYTEFNEPNMTRSFFTTINGRNLHLVKEYSNSLPRRYSLGITLSIDEEHLDGNQGVNFIDDTKFYLPEISSGGTEYEYFVKVI